MSARSHRRLHADGSSGRASSDQTRDSSTLAVPHVTPVPVIEYVSPAPMIEYIAPATAVTYYIVPSQQLPPVYTTTTVTAADNLDMTGLVYPQFSSTAVESFASHVVDSLHPLEE